MAIVELALLYYKPWLTLQQQGDTSHVIYPSKPPKLPQKVLDELHCFISAQAAFSGHPVTLLRCVENHALIYLIGGWDNIEQHINEWVPGRTNNDMWQLLEQHIAVKWMLHLQVDSHQIISKLAEASQHGICCIERSYPSSPWRLANPSLLDAFNHWRYGQKTLAGHWFDMACYGLRLLQAFYEPDPFFDSEGRVEELAKRKKEDAVDVVFIAVWKSAQHHWLLKSPRTFLYTSPHLGGGYNYRPMCRHARLLDHVKPQASNQSPESEKPESERSEMEPDGL